MRIIVAATTLALLAVSLAGAEMYQWVDESGAVTFKDTPPPASRKFSKVKVYKDSDFAPEPPAQPLPATRSVKGTASPSPQPPVSRNERFSGTVELYVTEWCGYCKKARSYLDSRGIPYVSYDIEKDSSARQRHKELGGRGVPLIIIGPNKMFGFSPETMEYYLNSSRQ